jgi:hypothetical protein
MPTFILLISTSRNCYIWDEHERVKVERQSCRPKWLSPWRLLLFNVVDDDEYLSYRKRSLNKTESQQQQLFFVPKETTVSIHTTGD